MKLTTNYHRVYYFFLKFCTCSYLARFAEGWSKYFWFCLDLKLLAKLKKKPGLSEWVETSSFFIFPYNSRPKKIETFEHSFVDTGNWETCANFQQEALNSMVVRAPSNFQFFRQITWFPGNNRALSKFRYQAKYLVSPKQLSFALIFVWHFCVTYLVLSKYIYIYIYQF